MKLLPFSAFLFSLVACGPVEATSSEPDAAHAAHERALSQGLVDVLALHLEGSVEARDALLEAAGIPHHQSDVVSVVPAPPEVSAPQRPVFLVTLRATCTPRIEPCLAPFDFTVTASFVTDARGNFLRLHARNAEDLRVLLSFPNRALTLLRRSLLLRPDELHVVHSVKALPGGRFDVEASRAYDWGRVYSVQFDAALELVPLPH